jgi:hypothetical protein
MHAQINKNQSLPHFYYFIGRTPNTTKICPINHLLAQIRNNLAISYKSVKVELPNTVFLLTFLFRMCVPHVHGY